MFMSRRGRTSPVSHGVPLQAVEDGPEGPVPLLHNAGYPGRHHDVAQLEEAHDPTSVMESTTCSSRSSSSKTVDSHPSLQTNLGTLHLSPSRLTVIQS